MRSTNVFIPPLKTRAPVRYEIVYAVSVIARRITHYPFATRVFNFRTDNTVRPYNLQITKMVHQ